MIIDKEKLNRNIWYEDNDGNIKTFPIDYLADPKEIAGMTKHVVFPLEITERISSVREDGTEREEYSISCRIGGGNEDVIIAMVNSGDYSLSEALMLLSHCCERCMNVLAHKYLNGKFGYKEYSEEWLKCPTFCEFCKDENKEESAGSKIKKLSK